MKIGVALTNALENGKHWELRKMFQDMSPQNNQTEVWTAVTFLSTLWYEALKGLDEPATIRFLHLYIAALSDGADEDYLGPNRPKDLDQASYKTQFCMKKMLVLLRALLGMQQNMFLELRRHMWGFLAQGWKKVQDDRVALEGFRVFLEIPIRETGDTKMRIELIREAADTQTPKRIIEALLDPLWKKKWPEDFSPHYQYCYHADLQKLLFIARVRNTPVNVELNLLRSYSVLSELSDAIFDEALVHVMRK